MKVGVDKELCSGDNVCIEMCPDVFEVDEEGLAQVKVDFGTLEELSRVARDDYGLGGAVQHGASTLPDEAFGMFPDVGTLEVHLATGFQNLFMDHPAFPQDLKNRIYQHLEVANSDERKPSQTDAQFYYSTRKKAIGPFKPELWALPEAANRSEGVS